MNCLLLKILESSETVVISFDIFLSFYLQSILVSFILLLKFLEHLVFNLGESNGDIHLTTSLRLF